MMQYHKDQKTSTLGSINSFQNYVWKISFGNQTGQWKIPHFIDELSILKFHSHLSVPLSISPPPFRSIPPSPIHRAAKVFCHLPWHDLYPHLLPRASPPPRDGYSQPRWRVVFDHPRWPCPCLHLWPQLAPRMKPGKPRKENSPIAGWKRFMV